MEKCYQCKTNEAEQQPIILVVSAEGASSEDKAMAVGKAIGADDREWMAMPICTNCHPHPTVKGHFFYRPQMKIALRSAGSNDLG